MAGADNRPLKQTGVLLGGAEQRPLQSRAAPPIQGSSHSLRCSQLRIRGSLSALNSRTSAELRDITVRQQANEGMPTLADDLQRLSDLSAAGALTAEEFAKSKAALIDAASSARVAGVNEATSPQTRK